jgi:hypothetical protein
MEFSPVLRRVQVKLGDGPFKRRVVVAIAGKSSYACSIRPIGIGEKWNGTFLGGSAGFLATVLRTAL